MLGRVAERRPRPAATGHDVVAEDVLELDGLGGRRDVVGRDVGEDRVLVEDVVELALEAAQLLVGQAEAREVGDVLDVGAREGGHAPMISDHRPRDDRLRCGHGIAIRPMAAGDVDALADAILRTDWGDRRIWIAFVVGPSRLPGVVAVDADGAVSGPRSRRSTGRSPGSGRSGSCRTWRGGGWAGR